MCERLCICICVIMTVWIPVIQRQCCDGILKAPRGNGPLPELTATPTAKHINNNKNNYHHHPQFAASSTTPSTAGRRGIWGSRSKSKPTLSSLGRSQGLCYLPSNQYDSSAVLWMLLLAVGKVLLITQKCSGDKCLLYHCVLTFTSGICVDHFITARAGEALSFSPLKALYVSHKKGMKPPLEILHPTPTHPPNACKECR